MNFIIELFCQIFLIILGELGLSSIQESNKQKPSWYLAYPGFILLGFVTGVISLILFHNLIIEEPIIRKINLVLSPIVAGLFFMTWNKFFRKKKVVEFHYFFYGFVFTFTILIFRYFYASENIH